MARRRAQGVGAVLIEVANGDAARQVLFTGQVCIGIGIGIGVGVAISIGVSIGVGVASASASMPEIGVSVGRLISRAAQGRAMIKWPRRIVPPTQV